MLLLLTAVLVVSSSCRFDYQEGGPAAGREDPPDFILHGLNYQVHMSDRTKIVFTGNSGEFRDDRKAALLHDISFLQYDRSGELVTRGFAEEAVLDLNTENAVMTGNVSIEVLDEDLVIYAPRLSWDRESKTLTSSSADMVTMEQSNGTMTQGRGFTGDLYRREFGFSGDARGVLYETD